MSKYRYIELIGDLHHFDTIITINSQSEVNENKLNKNYFLVDEPCTL